MSRVEWEEDTAFEPVEGSVASFCQARGIRWSLDDVETARVGVFVSEKALDDIRKHLGSNLSQEQGGVLLGLPYRDRSSNTVFVDVQQALPALDAVGSGIHLQFTPEAWAAISRSITDRFPNLVVVGWYHSHPGLGVFMSSTDRASQRAFYGHPWSLALVGDPHTGKEGWFIGPTCDTVREAIAYGEQPVEAPPAPAAAEPLSNKVRASHDAGYRQLVLPLSLAAIGLAAGVGGWRLLRRRRKAWR